MYAGKLLPDILELIKIRAEDPSSATQYVSTTIHFLSRRVRRKTQRNLDRGVQASKAKAAESRTVTIHFSIH